MQTTVNSVAAELKRKLYKQFVKGPYAKHNMERINYVINKVYKKLIRVYNSNELKVIARLQEHKIYPKVLQPIPILSSGGKLEHLYLADIVVGKTIIEVDGPLHKKEYDLKRDQLTAAQGYKTIRIPTSDLSAETIDSYLSELYK